ncbi:MAG: D-alanyl-D-alanine carboxypeptidase family protein [Ectobacillus sp.]
MNKKQTLIISIALVLAALFFALDQKPEETSAQTSQPDIYGKYGVTIDAKTGEVLYGKEEYSPAPPASLTKMMTALLLLEKVKPDEKIAITRHALNTEDHTSKIMLKAGETLARDEALKLLLTISADVVAESIAEHIAGSKEKFTKLMNKRAQELGAKHTSFRNASGADAFGHKASAYDLALITKEAIKHPQVLDCMNTITTAVRTSHQHKEITNAGRKELYNDPYAIASKSGHTSSAGHTLVTVDEKDGRRIISVVLKSDKKHLYKDAAHIAHYFLK